MSTVANIRQSIKRRFSHKEPDPDFDADSADEETNDYLNKEVEKAEKEGAPEGRPGTMLNRMLSYGNKKTEDQVAKDKEEYERRLAQSTAQGQTTQRTGANTS